MFKFEWKENKIKRPLRLTISEALNNYTASCLGRESNFLHGPQLIRIRFLTCKKSKVTTVNRK